jgi:hypothetical protein
MTDAQRAAMYRSRRFESVLVAHEDLKGASTAVLLSALARQLKAVADGVHAELAREIGAQLIAELCERHEIRLTHGYQID